MRELINQHLEQSLEQVELKPLSQAMRYCLLGSGKRIRPQLVLACAEASSSRSKLNALHLAFPAALAVEYVHTYSLIHDDLPAMDDDDVRRGKASCHVAFNEATAILVGDALLSDAFGLLAQSKNNAAQMCKELSQAIGSNGMVAGQVLDLKKGDVRTVSALKTAKLFECSCVLGGLAVNASKSTIENLREIGHNFGMAFQYKDDLDDCEMNESTRTQYVEKFETYRNIAIKKAEYQSKEFTIAINNLQSV